MTAALGRRLPAESRFITVEDLYAMDPDEQARTLAWVGPNHGTRYGGWMPVDRLLHRDPVSARGQASLCTAPSGLVVVVRTEPT